MMQPAPMEVATPTNPSTYNEIAETEYEIKIKEAKRGGDTVHQPKVVAKGSDYQIYFRFAPFSTLYATLGADGDKMGDQKKFTKADDQAAVSFTLKKGCAFPKVLKAMPNMLKDQQTTIDILKKQHVELLTAAFNSDDVKCAGKDKARKKATSALKKAGNKKPSKEEVDEAALKIYLEDAKDSGFKEDSWVDQGEDVEDEVIKIKRKCLAVRYKNGERHLVDNFPMFHRGTPTGEYYEKEYGDYVPRDTLVIMRGRRSWYTTPLMYGTNLTFDKDIVVLCAPKQRKKTNQSKPTIFFEDEEVETSGKRKRDDESEEAPSPKR